VDIDIFRQRPFELWIKIACAVGQVNFGNMVADMLSQFGKHLFHRVEPSLNPWVERSVFGFERVIVAARRCLLSRLQAYLACVLSKDPDSRSALPFFRQTPSGEAFEVRLLHKVLVLVCRHR
jgi:hypothetical protein